MLKGFGGQWLASKDWILSEKIYRGGCRARNGTHAPRNVGLQDLTAILP